MLNLVQLFATPWTISPPASSVHGIFQARILEWVAISYSRGFSQLGDQTHVSCLSCVGSRMLYHQHPPEAKGLLILSLVLFSPHLSCLLASSEQTGSMHQFKLLLQIVTLILFEGKSSLLFFETSVIRDLKRTLKSLGLQHSCYLQLLMFVN